MIRFAIALVCLCPQFIWAESKVTIIRLETGAVQAQVAVDGRGVAHLIYLKGEAAHCNIFYIRSSDGGATWSAPLRVNSQDGSAIAIGTVRGAHLALGRDSRVHVGWMGSSIALPKSNGKLAPMLYARMKSDGHGFEAQRNVISEHSGLDGGGSIAADDLGNVFVGWHAPQTIGGDEQTRRVWVARSTDDGATFSPEAGVSDPASGACGCCGMRMTVADGKLYILYRGAAEMIHRGMYLLDMAANLEKPHRQEIAPMELGKCIMSSAAFGTGPGTLAVGWETDGRVGWASVRGESVDLSPAELRMRAGKHPALAVNNSGTVLFVWAKGTGWNKGGTVEWQAFDSSGRDLKRMHGSAGDLGVWGSPAAFATAGGDFVIVY